MSWSYTITGDARPAFQSLDVPLQEAVLDLLDELCDEDDPLPPAQGELGHFVPVVHARDDGTLDVAVIQIFTNDARSMLHVTGVRRAV